MRHGKWLIQVIDWTVRRGTLWLIKRKWWVILVVSVALFANAQTTLWPSGLGFGVDELATVKRQIKNADGDLASENESSSVAASEEFVVEIPGRTLWDWLGVVGVPAALVILGAIFQQSQQKQSNNVAKEEALQLYIDRVSALLVDKNLLAIAGTHKPSLEQIKLLESAVDVVRARTLSILRRFETDREKKSSVIRFLSEAKVINTLELSLDRACLQGVSISFADFKFAKLRDANLEGANLERAILHRANLRGANLKGANLKGANLKGANLRGAVLEYANLAEADLRGANLQDAILYGANLRKADLRKCNLYRALLYDANCYMANVEGTTFYVRCAKFVNLRTLKCDEHTKFDRITHIASGL